MMRAAKTLTIRHIERITTVLPFLDVVSEHAMLWRCLGAALTTFHPFASMARVGQDLLAPLLMLICQQ